MPAVIPRPCARPGRPSVPASCIGPSPLACFEPDLDLGTWVRETFIDPDGPLANPDHEHLEFAKLGFLWSATEYRRRGMLVAGTAERGDPPPSIFGWNRDRWMAQLLDWFGDPVDFVVTLFGPVCHQETDVNFCALVEHELYHCAQQTIDGVPQFHRETGLPKWAVRAHDVETFHGVVRRYGAGSQRGVAELSAVLETGPEIAAADIGLACGTCRMAA